MDFVFLDTQLYSNYSQRLYAGPRVYLQGEAAVTGIGHPKKHFYSSVPNAFNPQKMFFGFVQNWKGMLYAFCYNLSANIETH